ncbi:hypothetical protein B0T21DRAFT_380369 [Apiosordaria backusii]|uniref:PHD-type domain-containing protein n=1 Tax=Apiosordaria backusii TaxID=314023 RepID=A0AA40EZW0_9PEZI|nr:hypothetical protein B0T21DRAFT_380369 [Apiosordaria backusii]
MPVTTISSNTRASRSRFSSPQVTAPESSTKQAPTAAAQGKEGKKNNFLERWLEPPVQNKPSYQEAGLVRQGVFDNMAPLGTMPKLGPAVPSTPTPAPPPPPPAPEEDETEEEDEMAESFIDPHLERLKSEDRGRAEGNNYREMTPAVSAPSRSHGSFSSRDVEAGNWGSGRMSQLSTDRRSQSRASAGRADSLSSHHQQTPASGASREADLRKITDKVVEAAVDAALQFCRYPTAWALRTLYDENCTSPDFLSMIEKVFMQKADAPTLSRFAKDIQKKKKEGKASNQGYKYFYGQDRDAIPPAKPAPYNHLINFGSTLERHIEQPAPEPQPAPGQGRQQEPPTQPEPVQEPVQQPLREPTPPPAAAAESPPVIADSVEPTPSEPEPASVPEPDTEPEQAPELPPQVNEPEPEPEPRQNKETEEPPRKKRKSARHSEATSKKMMMEAAAAATNGVNDKPAAETPRRHTRAASHSSTSTLSTARSLSLTPVAAQSQEIENEEEGPVSDAPPSRNSPVPAQPINGKRRRSNAPRKSKGGNVSPSRRSSVASAAPRPPQSASNSRRQTPAVDQSFVDQEPYDPGATVDTFITSLNGKRNKPAIVFTSKVGKLDENDEKTQRRRQAKEVTNGKLLENANTKKDASGQWEYSNARGLVDQPLADESTVMETPSALATRLRATFPTSRSTPAAREGRSTRSARKRSHDEVEDPTSPITAGFPNSAAPSTAANSRAGTPAALRPTKKARTGLRVKNSPMKKKTGPLAGIPRASGERSSPVGSGPGVNREVSNYVTNDPQDDNDDYCASCSSNGELICCDGCTRSFHFNCVDPPLARDAMPNEWFCNVCRMSRDPGAFPEHTGSFALLFEKLDAKNSMAFALPADIRNCFEGVRTGPEGEYEEIVTVVKPARKKKSDEEAPDFFRLRDAEGNAAICHSCQKHSVSDRAIIPCSACGLFWHLDCLDPPLANPPVLRTWKCPLHVDELLAEMPGVLAPAHRYRPLKATTVIRPAFSRGFVNDGYIEVVPEENEPAGGWRNSEAYGRTGKPIPPLGATTDAPSIPLKQRTLEEQQAVRNLAQLSGQGTANITTLIDTLISQADPDVVNLMSRGNANHFQTPEQLTRMDQQSLRAMLAQAEAMSQQIRQLLNAVGNGTAPAVPSLTTSMSIDGDSEADKVAPSPAATDDVPAMTQGEKTPALGDQSPEAPLEENPTKDANLPTTPTKATSVGTEPAIVESNSDEKNSVGEDVMDLE